MRPDRIVPLIIAVALFMENMDSTVIATSLGRTSERPGRISTSSKVSASRGAAFVLSAICQLRPRPRGKADIWG